MSRNSNCYYFNSPRGCRFGENCRFTHTVSSTVSAQIENFECPKDESSVKKKPEEALGSSKVETPPVHKTNKQYEKPRAVIKNPCFNFYKFGRCRFGENCKFLHETETESISEHPVDTILQTEVETKETENVKVRTEVTNKATRTQDHHRGFRKTAATERVCEFFKSGNCRWGYNCRYLHPSEEDLISLPVHSKNVSQAREYQQYPKGTADRQYRSWREYPQRAPFKPPIVQKDLKRSQASDEEIAKLKSTEIEQLKKRFTKKQLKELNENEDEKSYRISFSSSDPDWPYDVKVFDLLVKFPKQYPLHIFEVTLPVDQDLPETVRRYVEVSLKEWIDKKMAELESSDKLEMVFRPFIKWLDRNLESIVTEGLKQLKRELVAQASGLQFIPASQLQQKQAVMTDSSDDTDTEADETDDEPDEPLMIYRKNDDGEVEVYAGPDKDTDDGFEGNKENESLSTLQSENLFDDEKMGTEIRLRELQLKEQASTLSISGIKITLQCGRCKNKSDLSTPAGRVNQMACFKCGNMQYVIYRPVLAHQFSSVIGYLDIEGCLPFDLVLQDCPGRIGCLECSKETKIQGLVPGQVLNLWCNSCHSKLKTAAESVKFIELQPSGVDTDKGDVHVINVKKKKIPKDPMIREGFPLPEYGACKHYKKSYRWFRFPCCGKCYPCDVCHEEKEMDHEMIFATRMICGYCCKEQPYAPERPCISCQHAMTRAKTSHWEGGKGCRDKITMSRSDKNKYSNQSKTVSRKTQEKTKPSGKKNVKLRHSSA